MYIALSDRGDVTMVDCKLRLINVCVSAFYIQLFMFYAYILYVLFVLKCFVCVMFLYALKLSALNIYNKMSIPCSVLTKQENIHLTNSNATVFKLIHFMRSWYFSSSVNIFKTGMRSHPMVLNV